MRSGLVSLVALRVSVLLGTMSQGDGVHRSLGTLKMNITPQRVWIVCKNQLGWEECKELHNCPQEGLFLSWIQILTPNKPLRIICTFGWRKKTWGDQLSDLKVRWDHPSPFVLSLESQALSLFMKLLIFQPPKAEKAEGETNSCLLAIPLSPF